MTAEELNAYHHQLAKRYITRKKIERNIRKIKEAMRGYDLTHDEGYLLQKKKLEVRNDELQRCLH